MGVLLVMFWKVVICFISQSYKKGWKWRLLQEVVVLLMFHKSMWDILLLRIFCILLQKI